VTVGCRTRAAPGDGPSAEPKASSVSHGLPQDPSPPDPGAPPSPSSPSNRQGPSCFPAEPRFATERPPETGRTGALEGASGDAAVPGRETTTKFTSAGSAGGAGCLHTGHPGAGCQRRPGRGSSAARGSASAPAGPRGGGRQARGRRNTHTCWQFAVLTGVLNTSWQTGQ